jgi:hypothetical protein
MQLPKTGQHKTLFLVFVKDLSEVAWMSADNADEAKRLGVIHFQLSKVDIDRVNATAIDCSELEDWIVGNQITAMFVKQSLNMMIIDTGEVLEYELGVDVKREHRYKQTLSDALEQRGWVRLPNSPNLVMRAAIRNEILLVSLGVHSFHRQEPVLTPIDAMLIVVCLVEEDRELAWEYAAGRNWTDSRSPVTDKRLVCPNAPFVTLSTQLGFVWSVETMQTYKEIALGIAKTWWLA